MNHLVCQFKLPSSLAKNLFLVLLSGASDPRMAFLVPQLVFPPSPCALGNPWPHISSSLVSNRPRTCFSCFEVSEFHTN